MRTIDFDKHYPDEHTCRMEMKKNREKADMSCDRCGSIRLSWLANRYQWHCNDCKTRKTLRSGTIMQDSKLPVRIWYLCSALMTMSKKPMSAHEMQRQLNMKRYEPVFEMMHKIRSSMGQRDDLYALAGEVEFDEGQFSISHAKGTQLKRGLGSQRKQSVAVMAETALLEDLKTGKRSSQCRYFKMKVLAESTAESVDGVVKVLLDEDTIVLSDKSNRYVNITDHIKGHVTYYSDKETTNTTLRWVHIAISNAKRILLGIHHCIKGKNLQSYLDEFCYKLNRRYFGHRLFERLTIALATSKCIQAD